MYGIPCRLTPAGSLANVIFSAPLDNKKDRVVI